MGTGNRSSDQWSAAICWMDVSALGWFVRCVVVPRRPSFLFSFVAMCIVVLRQAKHLFACWWFLILCFSIVIVVVANQQFASSDSSWLRVLIFLLSFSNGFSLARFNLECLLSSSSVCTRHRVLRSPEFCGWVSWCHFFRNFLRGDIVISFFRMHPGSRIRFIAGWGTGECFFFWELRV